ncbi:MAG: SLBB domain-containing protein, partial [Magnetococcales bacterium]|nr:SLBB domain-containing protein [Magnetococcales bacterium]
MKKTILTIGILLSCFLVIMNTDALTMSSLSGRSINSISDPRLMQMLPAAKPGQRYRLEQKYRLNHKDEMQKDLRDNKNQENLEEGEPNPQDAFDKKPSPFYSDTYPEDLPIFGQDLFDKPRNSPAKELTTTVPGDYVLGPGDAFNLFFSGKEFKEVEVTIDGEGMIFVPDMGMLPAAGLHFNEFKTMLASRTKQKMIGFELSHVALSSLRTIRVFLLGNVKNPGTHHITSMTSLMELLIETGGILPVGSLRTVQLKRPGSPDKTIDLYNVLLQGKGDGDLRLRDGDTLFVPTIGNTIALMGTVKKPAVYELAKEETLAEITQLAGGLLPNAQLVKIERIDQNRNRTIIDLNLKGRDSLHAHIKSGDIIHVLPAAGSRKETVTITGYIDRGGIFQWSKGMRLSDVITSPDMLLPQTDMSHLLVVRTNPKNRQLEPLSVNLERALSDHTSSDNILLQPNDQIQLFSVSADHSKNLQSVVQKLRNQGRFNNIDKLVTITGNVRFPGEYPYVPNMSLRQLVLASGDVRSNTDLDYCLIVRSDPLGRIQPFSVRLREVFGMEGVAKLVTLKPKDQILIFALDEKTARKLSDKNDGRENLEVDPDDKRATFSGTSQENIPKDSMDTKTSVYDPFSIKTSKGMFREQDKDQDRPDQEPTGDLEATNKLKPTKPAAAKGTDIALENEEMENALVGFLLKNGAIDSLENKSSEAYRNQLVDPVLHENQNRLLQLLLKKRDLRQLVREEVQPVKEKQIKPRQVLLKPVLDKLQDQATKENPAQIIQIGGAVRYPGKYPLESGMRVSDLLLAGGGLA